MNLFSTKTTLLFCLFFLSLSATQNLNAQSTPVGFGASSASGAGEVFLSMGPISPVDPCIVYRLYYSPTASAPSDPTTATEYTFGSTGGDGGGTNPFGFNISGLTPDTDYTFWLYQFNTCTMTFSSPAIATQTSGDVGPPDAPVGTVCNTPTDAGSSGEVFLALGPNDVQDDPDCIIYRLYYSPTATAPSDPTTATEYAFGSTGGDGGGNNPFGFRISGLTPATDYTFWFYQYDQCLELFSEPTACMSASSGTAPMPVTWRNPLKAKVMSNNYVSLNWSVSQQINNDKFIIEHSSNGNNFSPIGDIRGEGTTNLLQEYSHIHRNPVLGYNYYRIHQVDYDGRYDYSNIATVWYGKDEIVTIYPNPASSEVTVSLTEETIINIKDFYGRVIKSLSLVEGENVISIDDLFSGIYILEFENGLIETLIKQ